MQSKKEKNASKLGKNICNVAALLSGNLVFPPWVTRTFGVQNGNPLQYSRLENLMDREALCATYSSRGRKESDTTGQLTCSIILLKKIFSYCFKISLSYVECLFICESFGEGALNSVSLIYLSIFHVPAPY